MAMFFANTANSQWLPDYRFTNHPDSSLTSPNNSRCIAALGSSIHAVWFDNRDGNYEIYYKRSTDNGAVWGTDTRLTNDNNISRHPAAALWGNYVHVVWNERVGANEEIFYKNSTDGGLTWNANVRLTNEANVSTLPSITVSGTVVIVFWNDTRDGNYEIYAKRSTDNGVTWGADTRLTNNSAQSIQASGVISGQTVHVAWHDARNGPEEIYYKRSTDGGAVWEADVRITSNAGVSWFPSIDAEGGDVFISWVELGDGNPEIYSIRSTNNGSVWDLPLRQTNNPAVSIRPVISVSGNNVHLTWQDDTDGNEEIYYSYSTDRGLNFSAALRLTNDTAESVYPCHTVSESGIHVVWREFRAGNWEVYYKRNPSGNLVTLHNNSSVSPLFYSLKQNYPNPFNPATSIEFSLPQASYVKLVVYDMKGREIETIVSSDLAAGVYSVEWGVMSRTTSYASGIYFYKLIAEGFTETRKMILIK